MGIVTAQELYNYALGDRGTVNYWAGHSFLHDQRGVTPPLPRNFTMEHVEAVLDKIHSRIIDGHFLDWKAMRPWQIVPVENTLDPSLPWIGWEIETGWQSHGARSNAIKDVFDNYLHVAVDEEGPRYGVEFTWSPKNNGVYEGEHPLMFVCSLGMEHAVYAHDPAGQVGTHVNISTPTLRAHEDDRIHANIATALNRALDEEFSRKDCARLFGRGSMYGGFFAQTAWIEGKLFDTTYDEEQAAGYIKVAERLAEVIEQMAVYYVENEPGPYRLSVHGLLPYLSTGKGLRVASHGDGWYVDGYDIELSADVYDEDEDDYDEW